MLNRAAFAVFVVFVMTQTGRAHDYWLQPERFFLSASETSAVHLYVGDHFVSETERPFQRKKTVVFQVISQAEVRDLKATAKDGEKPVCIIAPERAGSHLIVMERDWSHIEIEAVKFNEYLKHEGLTGVLEMRRKAGEYKAVGRERYRRYLKALIQVGDESDQTYTRKIGHRLEILPLTNPYTSNKGDRIAVSVLFEGKPLRGVRVVAYNRRGDDTKTQTAQTDDNGEVQFMLDRAGLWLIRLVHMQRCEKVHEFEWESFWAAYSFQLK
jgi:uncharacterized GH25 family protein